MLKMADPQVIEEFRLESGVTMQNIPVAYQTWGTLNSPKSNVIVLCHAFSGSANAKDWWRSMFDYPFDPSKYFIFCANALGSPYGSASSCTINPQTGQNYGPEFPLTTIRDDVRIQKMVLDSLGVAEVQFVIGGSMGGMLALEWALIHPEFVKNLIVISAPARQSPWAIGWSEIQRQCIFTDPKYSTLI
jgi:homoserine O-acetyltransferase